tara:strand:- start:1595 stop:2320 length:726 start_codon:yes stop_codon:yes gene_type:complete
VVDDHYLEKYSRQIILGEIGPEGQKKIKNASVLIIGAGGLGSSVIQYLGAAGIGKIGIADDDKVELSNLNRQLIYKNDNIGESKVVAAKNYLIESYPSTQVEVFKTHINKNNLAKIIYKYDLLADCSDNLETRLAINKICKEQKKTWVMSAVGGFYGQVAAFKPSNGKSDKSDASYDDFMKNIVFDEKTCSNTGSIGSAVGTIGGLQATEIIKIIVGNNNNLINKLLIFDLLTYKSKTFNL